MIHDLALRWLVTVLFALGAAGCALAIAAGGRRVWTSVVGQLLHIVMAVAMAVMVWPSGAALPTTAPMVFFLLAAAWFVVVALTSAGAGHRLVNVYHALMMLATSWMYAVMNVHVLPGQDGGAHQPSTAATTMPGMDMPGMNMGAMNTSSHPAGPPGWFTAVDWFWTIGFVLAALWWAYRYFAPRHGTRPADPDFGIACQAMMATGMAIMFGVML